MLGLDQSVAIAELFENWIDWCEDSNLPPGSKKAFGIALRDELLVRGFVWVHRRDVHIADHDDVLVIGGRAVVPAVRPFGEGDDFQNSAGVFLPLLGVGRILETTEVEMTSFPKLKCPRAPLKVQPSMCTAGRTSTKPSLDRRCSYSNRDGRDVSQRGGSSLDH